MKVYNKITTFLRWFILAFYHLSGSHQHRRNVDSPNHRLFYYPVRSPAVYLAVYLFCMAIIFIVLLSLLII